MLAKELIDRIERLGLLDQEIIEALREQLQQSGARVTPEAVAKLLVDNGQLTSFQATKLIGELRQSEYETPEPDLTDGIFPGDEVMAAEVIDDGVMEAVPVPADVTPVATAAPVGEAMPVDPATRPVRRRPPPPNDNVWDSFKIYGWAGIIVLLLLIGGAIYWILNQEGVDAAYARADEYYKMQRFDDAQVEFADFLESYPSDPKHSSSARVKITMAKLYKAASFTQEPWKGTEVAVKELPKIIQEPGLDNERADLADLLVDIADNITNEADKASDTKRKKMLLDKLDDHDVLIDDPAYIPGSLRTALAVKIKGMEESRGRVARDISRNVRLDKATQEMEAALAKQETKQAYDIRSALLQDFPELYDNERLQKLIIGASEIQQNLVAPATNLPKVSKGSANVDPVKTIVLTTQSGRRAPGLAGEVFYLRAGGSVMAFDGETGGLRWRRFVGYAEDLPPVRIFGDSGVLLSDSQTHSILRCDSDQGDVIWRAEIGERFLRPTSLRDSLFVTTPSGTILHQDVNSGDTKWAARIPQSLTAPPGINREREAQKVYQAGGHSNIYVLDLNNGSCVESFYLGHGAGTIAVPPVPLLGHVFVIENVDASEALVHILRVDPDGTNMRIAQPPVRLTGNVIEPAEIIRNRLAILTDRGQVKILDIEVTAAEKQVTESAVQQPFYDQPTATKMAFSDAMLWITGTQIGRYDLQYSSGRIVGKWNKHDGDAFIGRPMFMEDTLVHARELRGSSAIRVSAVEPKTGEVIWRTDVGAPVSSIVRAGGGFHAITSQASLFVLDRESLERGTTQEPLEQSKLASSAAKYARPFVTGENEFVMMDQGGEGKLLLYMPSRPREKVREVKLSLPSGRPAAAAVWTGNGVFMPLDSGRGVLFDRVTGALKATPFQPQSDPTAKISWSQPITVPDDPGQVVLADSRKKIYRLRVGDQLRALSQRDLDKPLLGPAASIGSVYIATVADQSADMLVGFEMSSLQTVFETALPNRVEWGPVTAGSYAVLKTADGQLHAFDGQGNEKFAVEVGKDRPVDAPLVDDQGWVLSMAGGTIYSIDPNGGSIQGTFELGQPIFANPLAVSNKLLIPGEEGVVYFVDRP